MRKIILSINAVLLFNIAFAQQKIQLHNSGSAIYSKAITAVDSIKLEGNYSQFRFTDAASNFNIQKIYVDSLSFTTSTVLNDKIYIIYNGTENATIINPYAASGVSINAVGGTVTVAATSGITNLEYNVLGTSANGSLTIATDKDINLVLNNLTLTNPSGAAIAVSGGKISNLLPKAGTSNSLSDGTGSTKNGTINTDGPVVINQAGNLSIAGIKKHGINTSSVISLLNGNVTISSAASDGFHSEGYTMSGGTATISSLADGIDAGNAAISISGGTINITSTAADVKGIKTGTGSISFTGGNINLDVSGAQSKAISAKGNITVSNGTFGITLSGATVLTASGSGFDPSYATAFKSDSLININGGTFTITAPASADGARGFSADKAINVTAGNITVNTAGNGAAYTNTSGVADSYSVAAFSADTDINISGGILTITNTGINGKAFSADSNIVISGTAQVGISNSGNAAKSIKADGMVTINGGTVTINISGATVLAASGSGYDPSYPTGIKANSIVVNSGTVTITGTTAASGAKGLSSNTTITVNGGNISVTNAGNGAVYNNASGVADSYASAAFSSDTHIIINAGTVTTNSSGTGGKGLKADGSITIGTGVSSPVLNITTTGNRFLVSGTNYSHPKTIVATGAINIVNGTNTINSTDDGIHSDLSVTISGGNNIINAISSVTAMGEGVEAPTISFTGGVTNITASNDGINATYGTVAGGTESNDGSNLYISGGIIIVAGKDAIDCNGNLTITGGTTIVTGPTSQPEEGIDFNGTFLMNGGLLISGGSNSGMTKNFSTGSTQRSIYLRSSAQLAATSMLHIRNTSGTEMVTFKPKNAVYYFHFSSPAIAASTAYQVYFGGSYTGGSFSGGSSGWGLYTGGTYSTTGATLKTTLTTSASSTLNTTTF